MTPCYTQRPERALVPFADPPPPFIIRASKHLHRGGAAPPFFFFPRLFRRPVTCPSLPPPPLRGLSNSYDALRRINGRQRADPLTVSHAGHDFSPFAPRPIFIFASPADSFFLSSLTTVRAFVWFASPTVEADRLYRQRYLPYCYPSPPAPRDFSRPFRFSGSRATGIRS